MQDAFAHYLGQLNRGRRIVLIGHSQGAEMVMRLVHRFFDDDTELRARLVVVLAIGGPANVRHGQLTGRSHDRVPMCASPDELGCVVGYHSFRATGRTLKGWIWDDPDGEEATCVNPAGIGASGWRALAGAYFPTSGPLRLVGTAGVTTPYVLLKDRYYAACVEDAGRAYLLVADAPAPGDLRPSPMDLAGAAWNTDFGLHVLDIQLALRDLIELVRRKAARGR